VFKPSEFHSVKLMFCGVLLAVGNYNIGVDDDDGDDDDGNKEGGENSLPTW
jgi:hypothetical protein